MRRITLSAGRAATNAIEFHAKNVGYFDAQYRTCDDFRQRYRVWSALIAKYSSPEFRVLDVGCGTGVFTTLAAQHNKEVVGIDGSLEMIDFCRQQPALRGPEHLCFIHCAIERLPGLHLEAADLMLCSSVLEYVDHFDMCLQILSDLVKPGGHLILSLPNKSAIYRRLERLSFTVIRRPRYLAFVKNVMTLDELHAAIQMRGGTVIEHYYYGNVHRTFATIARLPLPRLLNNLFVAVCRRK